MDNLPSKAIHLDPGLGSPCTGGLTAWYWPGPGSDSLPMKQMPISNWNNIPLYLLSHNYENKYYRKGPNSCPRT